jgi:hypothetical protein
LVCNSLAIAARLVSILPLFLPELTHSTRQAIRTKRKEGGGNMYATVRKDEGVTDPNEATRLVNEGFIQLISQIPGFVSYYWVDVGGGVMISTSVFHDKASAEESNRKAADYARENMRPVLPNLPQITAGEVVAHKAK